MVVDDSCDIDAIAKIYMDHLPSPELLQMEWQHWRHKIKQMDANNQGIQLPDSCASAIKMCDKMYFPNIYTLLQIACTLPVTSCECERSNSTMRRLHNFMRASMNEDRLSHLAILHTHYSINIDLDDVVNRFSKRNTRKMKLNSVLL